MTHPLELAIQIASRTDGIPTRAQLRRWVKAAQQGEMVLTLRITETAEAQQLNRDYRGKDYATNVLTFVYDTSPVNGDVVLCAPVIAREAAEQGKTLEAHYAHLIIHGVLHLQGYDHEHKSEAVTMESVERFIMQHLAYPDPYEHGRRQSKT